MFDGKINKSDVPFVFGARSRHTPGMAHAKTSVPHDRLAEVLATQRQVLQEEQSNAAQIVMRAEAARKVLAECDIEHEASMKVQAALTNAISIYEGLVGLSEQPKTVTPVVAVVAPAAVKPPVARLGKQHYRMLVALRDAALPLEVLAITSCVLLRRAKTQMAEDVEKGFVIMRGETYSLTARGRDVLSRFEEFRRSAGQELPPRQVSSNDDDMDDGEDDVPSSVSGDTRRHEMGETTDGAT